MRVTLEFKLQRAVWISAVLSGVAMLSLGGCGKDDPDSQAGPEGTGAALATGGEGATGGMATTGSGSNSGGVDATGGANSTGGQSTQSAEGPTVGDCPVFPADSPWNQDISALPTRADSDTLIDSIGRTDHVHPDFGTEWEGAPIGIPYVLVGASQQAAPIIFTAYGDESDPGPYPMPADAPIEGGTASDGDRHVIAIATETCTLYELYRAFPQGDGSWEADSGAVFDLKSNDEHPWSWTSADAAGLPIFPGLARYDEVVEKGELEHALRVTVSRSRRAIIAPARHYASNSDDASLPPMGLRLRMKASYDCFAFSTEAQVVCSGLKRFGLIVADNGSDWYISGAPDARWNDVALGDLKTITGDAFEAVDTGPAETY